MHIADTSAARTSCSRHTGGKNYRNGGVMSNEVWFSANTPPNTARDVMLRFDETGTLDRRGWFRAEFNAWAFDVPGMFQHQFVYPIAWRELRFDELRLETK